MPITNIVQKRAWGNRKSATVIAGRPCAGRRLTRKMRPLVTLHRAQKVICNTDDVSACRVVGKMPLVRGRASWVDRSVTKQKITDLSTPFQSQFEKVGCEWGSTLKSKPTASVLAAE